MSVMRANPEGAKNLHHLSNWVCRSGWAFQLSTCLPDGLHIISPRHPDNYDQEKVRRKAERRLSWVLVQSDGKFLCTVIDSCGRSSHVVGVHAAERKIIDPENEESLPLNQSGFNACCSGDETCVGLGDVKELRMKDITNKD
jgi:hypothetical protein